jgi:predicted dehydrogenase
MTQTSLKANIGVVGLGRMGQRHALNVLHQVPRARLFAVCSPAPHEIEWAKKDLEPEGVQVFDTFEAMIRTSGLDAVVIASPSELHFSQTLAAMELGIHVLCEKPVTKDTAQVRGRKLS